MWYGSRSAAPRRPAIDDVVDDRSPALLGGVPAERGAQSEEDAAEVDRDHTVEFVRSDLGEGREGACDARVQVVEVDPAEVLHGGGRVAVDVLLDGDVGRHGQTLGEGGRHLVGGVGVLVDDDHPCALAPRRLAVAAPIPLPPPVTTATLPASPSSATAVSRRRVRLRHGRRRLVPSRHAPARR